jgi:protease-4
MSTSEYGTYNQPPYQTNPSYQQAPRRKSRWWIAVLAILGVLFVGFLILVLGIFALVGGLFESKPIVVKQKTVLRLNVPGYLEEYPAISPTAIFSSDGLKPICFLDVLSAIKRAKTDDNIVGIYFRAGDIMAGYAKATEIRDALKEFKESGKLIYAYLEIGSELDYYLASVADSIFMSTEGIMELNGYAAAELFFTGTYEKLGIDFYVQQFEEYKSAGEPYSRNNFSDPARRELRELIDQYYRRFVGAVAESRSMDEGKVDAALQRGLYSADTLLALNFIDGIKSETDVKEALHQVIEPPAKPDSIIVPAEMPQFISLRSYINSTSYHSSGVANRDKQIAVVVGSGLIVSGDSGDNGLFDESLLASDTFIRNLHKARDNSKVKAIIIRIDSPGGSVVASDVIWEEIRKTKHVKPVYASMSDVAASGGYYIAMACDTIIAHPETITGSIGVISMIPNLSGTIDKIGASVDTVTSGKSALFLFPYLPFSERDKATLYAISKGMYDRFVSRVAESRGKTFAETRAVAKGRVWMGQAGRGIGLVDTLGGLHTAIQIAKRRIGVPPNEKVRIRLYPEPVDPLTSLIKLLGNVQASHSKAGLQNRDLSQTLLLKMLPDAARSHIKYWVQLGLLAKRERVLMALPNLPVIE